MLERVNEKVKRMPQPQFVELPKKLEIAFTDKPRVPIALTINWQWVLGAISEALVTNNFREIIKLLCSDLEIVQLLTNAIDDIYDLTRKPIDRISLTNSLNQLEVVKSLLAEFKYHQNHQNLDLVVDELDSLLVQLLSLGVSGLGAYMIMASLQLALLQAQTEFDSKQRRAVKAKLIEYIESAKTTTPQLYRLSVGRIDKTCHCLKWKTQTQTAAIITEYECRYFDGRDTHIFRNLTPAAIAACNQHRLQMFYTVTAQVNSIAVIPIRTAIKKWRQLAANL